MSPGRMIAMVVGGVLVIGAILYATMSGPSTDSASNPPPTTTGQGGAPVNPPAAPRPTPKLPTPVERAPAPITGDVLNL